MNRSLCCLVALLATTAAARAETAWPIESVTNIDIEPDAAGPGSSLLARYVARLQHAPHVAAATLLRQDGTSNHFMLLLGFRSRADRDAYLESADTRSFRGALFRYLGSPYDERLSVPVPPADPAG